VDGRRAVDVMAEVMLAAIADLIADVIAIADCE
jgi:hypothetical protein